MPLQDALDLENDEVPLEHYTLACVLTQWIEDGQDPEALMHAMQHCRELFVVELGTVH